MGGDGALTGHEGRRRVALFGGSFDPPHLGHTAIALAAQKELQLDRVLFAPAGRQPLKAAGATASFEDRVAMTQLAITGMVGFELSLIDAPTADGRANYTIDSLLRLRAELPDTELYFLMGADSLRTFNSWHRAAELPFVAKLVVAARPGELLTELELMLPEGAPVLMLPEGAPVIVLRDLAYRENATEIRRALANNDTETAKQWLAPEVLNYIQRHGLYRQPPARR